MNVFMTKIDDHAMTFWGLLSIYLFLETRLAEEGAGVAQGWPTEAGVPVWTKAARAQTEAQLEVHTQRDGVYR